MNQKEYNLIAKHISQNRLLFNDELSRRMFAKAIAYELSITYKTFDVDKFLTACGL